MSVYRATHGNGGKWGAIQSAPTRTTIVNNYNFFGPSVGHSPRYSAPAAPQMNMMQGMMGLMGGISLGVSLFNMFRPQQPPAAPVQINREIRISRDNPPNEDINAIVDEFLDTTPLPANNGPGNIIANVPDDPNSQLTATIEIFEAADDAVTALDGADTPDKLNEVIEKINKSPEDVQNNPGVQAAKTRAEQRTNQSSDEEDGNGNLVSGEDPTRPDTTISVPDRDDDDDPPVTQQIRDSISTVTSETDVTSIKNQIDGLPEGEEKEALKRELNDKLAAVGKPPAFPPDTQSVVTVPDLTVQGNGGVQGGQTVSETSDTEATQRALTDEERQKLDDIKAFLDSQDETAATSSTDNGNRSPAQDRPPLSGNTAQWFEMGPRNDDPRKRGVYQNGVKVANTLEEFRQRVQDETDATRAIVQCTIQTSGNTSRTQNVLDSRIDRSQPSDGTPPAATTQSETPASGPPEGTIVRDLPNSRNEKLYWAVVTYSDGVTQETIRGPKEAVLAEAERLITQRDAIQVPSS